MGQKLKGAQHLVKKTDGIKEWGQGGLRLQDGGMKQISSWERKRKDVRKLEGGENSEDF